ncbi:hypothetical protein MKW94_024324 [Papaver nudicaule]|uniref:HXXXD-type acyl-transferase family protein n=1 Tax=Papaver nudicaule TaxID=74823 RepID=A0AA41VL88_PAPNU|nr:hypothetical protein [Papaver nudicaule]
MADILEPVYVPRILHDSFFPLNGVMSYEGFSKPLLAVQVTELIDGVFIGCSLNHSVCDGTSFCHFYNTWYEISRLETPTTTGCNPENHRRHRISRPPLLKRWFPRTSDVPIHLPFFITDKCFKDTYTTTGTNMQQLESKLFHFTVETIAAIKAKANLDISGKTPTKISSLQALLAHFWVAITRAKCLDHNDETSYVVAIGCRDRLKPPVFQEYFGNLSPAGQVTVKVGELLEKGVGWGALLMNQMIMSHDDKAIRESWDSRKNSLLITGSSPRFDMYGCDFGWGKPIAVRSGYSSKHDGVLSAHPTPIKGNVEIEACLPIEIFKALENNTEFMEFVISVLPDLVESI